MTDQNSSKKRVLYVEDEPALAHIVKDMLEVQGYHVSLVEDGGLVLKEASRFMPDLCLLDIMLPHVDGFTLGSQLRQIHPQLPIIFLTAKNQTEDVVKGFHSGGNDYLKKPFSLEELLVRMENLLSIHVQKEEVIQAEIQVGKYTFQPAKLSLTLDKEVRKLTYRESEIIKLFCMHINGVVHKKEILLQIWGDDSFNNSRSLDVYINKLREFFSEDPNVSILTLRGVGYQFNVT